MEFRGHKARVKVESDGLRDGLLPLLGNFWHDLTPRLGARWQATEDSPQSYSWEAPCLFGADHQP